MCERESAGKREIEIERDFYFREKDKEGGSEITS